MSPQNGPKSKFGIVSKLEELSFGVLAFVEG